MNYHKATIRALRRIFALHAELEHKDRAIKELSRECAIRAQEVHDACQRIQELENEKDDLIEAQTHNKVMRNTIEPIGGIGVSEYKRHAADIAEKMREKENCEG